MKIDFEKIDDVNGIITVNIEEADYADAVKKELKRIGKTHPEPGFRAGHVPTGILEKKYGKGVKYETVSKLVGEQLYTYIEENKLPVLGQPVPFKENDLNPDEKEFTLKFKVGTAPEIDVKADKDVKIPYYKIEISDEIIDKQDEHMRARFGKQVPGEEVNETALVKGVLTELNADGTPVENGVVVENGIVAPQYFKDEDQKKLFIGKHVGDKVVFNPWKTCDGNEAELSSMLNVDKKDVENFKGDFSMDIKEIIVLQPAELGEEFYKEAFGENGNVTDETSYRAALKSMIENSVAPEEFYRFTIDAKNALLDKVGDIKLPDEILKEYLIINNKDVNDENVGEVYDSNRKSLEWDLIKEKVASQLEVKVTEEDLKEMAKMMARQQFAQYGMANAPEEAIERFAGDILKDQKSLEQIKARTAEQKFYNALKDAVTIEEKNVTAEQFNDLFKDAE